MKLSRRTFLKTSGIAGAGLTAAAAGTEKFLLWAEEAGLITPTYVPTFCEICFWKCGAITKVLNGRVVKLDGNPVHGNSRGKLCDRAQGGLGLLYDKYRIKTPLINVGKRGAGNYRKASWDEALGLVAEKMKGIKQQYGPEAMALFTHGTPTDHFLPLLFAYGTPTFAQCRGPRDVGYELTFGEGPGSPERVNLVNSKVMVLIGYHLGENMHNSQVQDFAEAIGRGSRLIVVEPRYSIAAAKAQHWLPIRPATDLALLLAWINVIITEGLYDRAYLDQLSIEAINKLDLLVVVDVMPLDTAMLADVILPECTYLERHDALAVGKGTSLSVSLRQPVIKPLYDSRPGWWIAKELAKRLDLAEYFPWTSFEEKLQAQCQTAEISYDDLKRLGCLTLPDTAAPYLTPEHQPEFKTASGKIELYSKELLETRLLFLRMLHADTLCHLSCRPRAEDAGNQRGSRRRADSGGPHEDESERDLRPPRRPHHQVYLRLCRAVEQVHVGSFRRDRYLYGIPAHDSFGMGSLDFVDIQREMSYTKMK